MKILLVLVGRLFLPLLPRGAPASSALLLLASCSSVVSLVSAAVTRGVCLRPHHVDVGRSSRRWSRSSRASRCAGRCQEQAEEQRAVSAAAAAAAVGPTDASVGMRDTFVGIGLRGSTAAGGNGPRPLPPTVLGCAVTV